MLAADLSTHSLAQPIGSLLASSSGSSISVFLGSTYGPIFAGIAGTFGVYILSVSGPRATTTASKVRERHIADPSLPATVPPLPRPTAPYHLDASVPSHRSFVHQHLGI